MKVKSYLRTHFSSLASVSIRGLSVVAGFIVTFLIGRWFGPLAIGQYALVTQTGMFLSIVAVGGMDMAIVRRFSATVVRGLPLARTALLGTAGMSIGTAFLIIGLLGIGGPTLFSHLFGTHLPEHALMLTSLILLARTTLRVMAAVLRSQNAHVLAQSMEVLIIPTVVAVLLATGLLHDLPSVLWATALVGILAGFAAILRGLSYTVRQGAAIDVPLKEMFAISVPLWLTAVAMNIADWYGLTTAARMLGVYEAGLFRVAFQIASALTFVAMGLYNVFTARISAALEADDIYHVARLSRASTRLATLIVLPIVLCLIVGAHPLLGGISKEFAEAAVPLQIMLVGQLIYVTTGPAGLVLAMAGHQRLNLAVSASVTGALLIVAPVATYLFGLTGLAVAMALVPVTGNLVNLILVRRLEHLNIITGRYFEPDGEDEQEKDESLGPLAPPAAG